jgi:transposase
MGKGQRFTEEFRVEAVKQVTERGFAVKDVSKRLGVSPYSLYQWIKRYGIPTEERLAKEDRAGRIKKL